MYHLFFRGITAGNTINMMCYFIHLQFILSAVYQNQSTAAPHLLLSKRFVHFYICTLMEYGEHRLPDPQQDECRCYYSQCTLSKHTWCFKGMGENTDTNYGTKYNIFFVPYFASIFCAV